MDISYFRLDAPALKFMVLQGIDYNSIPSAQYRVSLSEKLKAKPSECIIFEDSLAGVEAAKRAGKYNKRCIPNKFFVCPKINTRK